MLRRLPPGLAALVLVALVAAACSSDDRTSTSDAPQQPTTSTTSARTPSTTAPGDLAVARVALTPVASATLPTTIASRPGDPTVYVGEQSGVVRAVVPGAPASATVLDLTAQVSAGGERGLLGLVFSPDGERLFVHYSAAGTGDTTVDEYAFTPSPGGGGTADPATRRTLLTVEQPQPNHNGGQLAFGPDGALYLGLGDGGGAGDQGEGHASEGNGQSPDTLLGKIVRIDTAAGTADIFASGLRNPWRFSFDPATDDLWIGDVGQGSREEIDRVPFAQARDANFGWPLLEGSADYRGGDSAGTVLPVFEVGHETGACAIVGGSVYRGTRIPDLAGAYLFTDNCDGRIHALKLDDAGNVALVRDLGVSVDEPTTFGVGDDSELYVASGSGGVFRIDAG